LPSKVVEATLLTFVGLIVVAFAFNYLVNRYIGTRHRIDLERYKTNVLQLCDAFKSGGEVKCMAEGKADSKAITFKLDLSLFDSSGNVLLHQYEEWPLPQIYVSIPLEGYLSVESYTKKPFAYPNENFFDVLEFSRDNLIKIVAYPKPTVNITSFTDDMNTYTLSFLLPSYHFSAYGKKEALDSINFTDGTILSVSPVGVDSYPDMVWIGYRLDVHIVLEGESLEGEHFNYEWKDSFFSSGGNPSVFIIKYNVQKFIVTTIG
jgi:hypothetical protein